MEQAMDSEAEAAIREAMKALTANNEPCNSHTVRTEAARLVERKTGAMFHECWKRIEQARADMIGSGTLDGPAKSHMAWRLMEKQP
jgi:hypothetical protein